MFKDMNNDQQDKWIWRFIFVILAIVFAVIIYITVYTIREVVVGLEPNGMIVNLSETEGENVPLPDIIPVGQPDLSPYETYNPIPGYIGSAIGGVSGFGFLGWYIKKRDAKLDSIDNKVTKIDTEVSVLQSEVKRNIDDIQAVRKDLQDGERVRRIYQDLGGLKND